MGMMYGLAHHLKHYRYGNLFKHLALAMWYSMLGGTGVGLLAMLGVLLLGGRRVTVLGGSMLVPMAYCIFLSVILTWTDCNKEGRITNLKTFAWKYNAITILPNIFFFLGRHLRRGAKDFINGWRS